MIRRLRLIALLALVGTILLLGYNLLSYKVLDVKINQFGRAGTSLDASAPRFRLHGKNFTILSGAIHYFRVVPAYWEDRLLKLKAMGLNTVETYMPWNLHEPFPNKFDFSGILNVKEFVLLAKKLGLYVIMRPGPYICAEWDHGGLPAWLLRDPQVVLRSSYDPYQFVVKRYIAQVMRILGPLQASYGGPIIAFQIENEYMFEYSRTRDKKHFLFLHDVMRREGVTELLLSSDSQHLVGGALTFVPPDVLVMPNFQHNPVKVVTKMRAMQAQKPVMAMEFWTGWFDTWNQPHQNERLQVGSLTQNIGALLDMGASFNLYMFHGGTNFGFLNGANRASGEFRSVTTSYDYNAPLSEAGDITPKYLMLRALLEKKFPGMQLPPVPHNSPKMEYGEVSLALYVKLTDVTQYTQKPHQSEFPLPMEYLDSGQAYGFVLYRSKLSSEHKSITVGEVRDFGMVMLDKSPVQQLAGLAEQTVFLPESVNGKERELDLLIENMGRMNFDTLFNERKGILGSVMADKTVLKNWQMFSFDFTQAFLETVDSGALWLRTPPTSDPGPALFKGNLVISGKPQDTFMDMEGWSKGVVFINGVNIGRYWSVGPQRTLYVPAPILKNGINRVIIFEMLQSKRSQTVSFVGAAILDKPTVFS
ncbi:hypothetical protein EMCRGX_G014039 [Ephydatia muelleri]